MKVKLWCIVLCCVFLVTVAHGAGHVVSVSGDEILLNGQAIKVIGMRCSNALISDSTTQALIGLLDTYKSYGCNTVSVFFMGSRFGDVKGYNPDATLNATYASRMAAIIEAADQRGMIVLVGCLYWSTSRAKEDLGHWGQSEADTAVANTVHWLSANGYRNVIVDADNEGMSPWNINQMVQAGHAIDSTIMIANNGGDAAPDADLNIHFGPKESGKPWFNSEATVSSPLGGYWGTYSKETHQQDSSYYNYSRIGRYTSSMKTSQINNTWSDVSNYNGYMLASTWLQCAPDEGVNGPHMEPGGYSNIADVDADIDALHPDAGVKWWLESVHAAYGAWVPPDAQPQAPAAPVGLSVSLK